VKQNRVLISDHPLKLTTDPSQGLAVAPPS